MGKHSTGAITTGGALRIELSNLIKIGLFKQESKTSGTICWTNGSKIEIQSEFTDKNKFIRLIYSITNNTTGEAKNYDYKIEIASIPSNLGKGEILYFVCPTTGNYARILYKCYGSPIWKSRNAYSIRIYYRSQIHSKYDHYNNMYWDNEKDLERLSLEVKKSHYKGKLTRKLIRIQKLEDRKQMLDFKRWQLFTERFHKDYNSRGL